MIGRSCHSMINNAARISVPEPRTLLLRSIIEKNKLILYLNKFLLIDFCIFKNDSAFAIQSSVHKTVLCILSHTRRFSSPPASLWRVADS